MWLAGITVATFFLATAALAAISPFDPSKGTVKPGESTKTSFSVTDSVTSCFVATAPPKFDVSFDGLGLNLLPANCALGGAKVTMTVKATPKALPGDYTVTITETALGGALIGTHEWPFTVPAPPEPTTTTIAATTTTAPANTTTTSGGATTTSTPSSSPTSTGGPTTSPPSTVGSASSPASTVGPATSPSSAVGATTTTPGPSEGTSPPEESEAESVTESAATDASPNDEDAQVLAAGLTDNSSPPSNRYPRLPLPDGAESEVGMALADPLGGRNANPFASFADASLSPGAIAEFIFGSLFAGVRDLMIPMLIAALVGLAMVWRMRLEVNDDELALSRQSLG
jgi:hypothetical protein